MIAPTDLAPMVVDAFSTRLTWLAAIAEHDTQCRDYMRQIGKYARYLEADLVSILDAIEFSAHVASMRMVRDYYLRKGVTLQVADLKPWAANYFRCYEAARRLARYAEQYRLTYRIVG